MNLARMKALETRAKLSQGTAVQGDIVTPILATLTILMKLVIV